MSGDSSETEDSTITRRRLVASGAATWATVSLAGCDRIDDPGVPTTEETTTTTTTDDDGGNGNGTGGTVVTNETTTTDDPTTTEQPTTSSGCASIRQFAPGMEVGLHVDVYDTDTGRHLGADAVDSVTVEFPNADFGPLELNWSGDHERYSEVSWGAKIETDDAAEPGTYRYEVTVEGEDSVVGRITDQFEIV